MGSHQHGISRAQHHYNTGRAATGLATIAIFNPPSKQSCLTFPTPGSRFLTTTKYDRQASILRLWRQILAHAQELAAAIAKTSLVRGGVVVVVALIDRAVWLPSGTPAIESSGQSGDRFLLHGRAPSSQNGCNMSPWCSQANPSATDRLCQTLSRHSHVSLGHPVVAMSGRDRGHALLPPLFHLSTPYQHRLGCSQEKCRRQNGLPVEKENPISLPFGGQNAQE